VVAARVEAVDELMQIWHAVALDEERCLTPSPPIGRLA
jgi:hypothetical protein